MRRQLDIADVEARTKIRAKYLRALENEEWGALPGHTFVKTFLRTYAEMVGVDAQVLVEEYRTTQEVDEELELQSLPAQPRRSRGEPRRRAREPRGRPPPAPPSRAAIAVGLLVAVVAFLLVLGLLSGNDENSGSKQANGKAGQTRTNAERRARRQPRRTPAAAGVNVRIAPTTPTYVCVDTGAGTGIVFQGTLEQPRTFKNPKRLRLNLGKRALDLRVNGKRVQIAPSPEPVGFDLTPAGVKELPEGTRPCA
jgi:cytoskeletal protein RodZ